MPTTTSRLGLVQPVGTDAVSELRISITSNAATLDNSVIVTEGTLVSRPAGSYVGQTYYGTDTGLWYFYNGSAWETVMLAGAWTDLTLSAGVTAVSGYDTPGARLEGDVGRLRGAVTGISGASGGPLGTLASAVCPTVTGPITLIVASGSSSVGSPSQQISIAEGGLISTNFQATIHPVYLDGLTFTRN